MEREHLLWMLERAQLAYYAKDEVIASPQQGQADSVATLIVLSKDIRELTHNMMAQGVVAEQITHSSPR
ncbi:MAG: hypothetical protein Q8P42_10440 [Gallionella sp.]|nr:hypothetical protein [Gallionella sp.]